MPETGSLLEPFSADVRFESMEYVSEVPEQKELTRSQSASLHFFGKKDFADAHRLIFGTDLYASTYFTRQSSQFGVNEFYLTQFVSSKPIEKEHITVGRKLYDWSEVDRHWNLGLWESKLYNDAIRTESQGLTGFFSYFSGDSGEILFFISPIFIPNQGPEVKEDEGNLTADSRWYRTPSPRFKLLGQVNTVDYKLDIPDRMSLASRAGAAVHVKLGAADGPFLKVSFGRKPVNELLLERQNFKRPDSLKLDVTVRPRVTYHHIASADLGYHTTKFHTSVSYMSEKPDVQDADRDWAIQRLQPIDTYGVHASVQAEQEDTPALWNRPTEIALDYLKVQGGEIEDYLSDGSKDSILLFDQRLQYYNSLRGQLKTRLGWMWHRPLNINFSYLYDFDQRGSLMQSELNYAMTQKWVWILGADFLGVEDEAHAKPTSFLNQNRANDRYYAGMGYAF